MGVLKEIMKTVLLASAERRGHRDGIEGKPVPFEFTGSFPQNSEPAKAYFRGRNAGQESAGPKTLNKVGNLIDKITGE